MKAVAEWARVSAQEGSRANTRYKLRQGQGRAANVMLISSG